MAHRRSWYAVVLGNWALAAAVASGADANRPAAEWPGWRGAVRDGMSRDKNLLQAWGDDGPPLAWKASGLGRGWGSIALAANRIYTLGQRGDVEYLIALSADDGRELWALKLGEPSTEAGTPTVDGDHVYAIGPYGDLVCVAAADGREVWRKSFTRDFGGSVPTWKYCESPLIDGERLICTPGSAAAALVALNKRTGEVLWKCTIQDGAGSGAGYSSVVVSEGAGVRQYVQLLGAGRGCVGVAARDGKLLWSYERVGNGTASIPTPVVSGDYVFCSSGYGTGSALLRLEKEGSGVKASEVYFLKGNVFQNHHGGMLLVGDHVYSGHGHGNGIPICIELKTGKIVWGGNERGPGAGSAAIVCGDGQLYFRYENGLMALISASPDGYRLNGTFMIPEVHDASWSHPVVTGGKLYLREQDNLFVYNVSR